MAEGAKDTKEAASWSGLMEPVVLDTVDTSSEERGPMW